MPAKSGASNASAAFLRTVIATILALGWSRAYHYTHEHPESANGRVKNNKATEQSPHTVDMLSSTAAATGNDSASAEGEYPTWQTVEAADRQLKSEMSAALDGTTGRGADSHDKPDKAELKRAGRVATLYNGLSERGRAVVRAVTPFGRAAERASDTDTGTTDKTTGKRPAATRASLLDTTEAGTEKRHDVHVTPETGTTTEFVSEAANVSVTSKQH